MTQQSLTNAAVVSSNPAHAICWNAISQDNLYEAHNICLPQQRHYPIPLTVSQQTGPFSLPESLLKHVHFIMSTCIYRFDTAQMSKNVSFKGAMNYVIVVLTQNQEAACMPSNLIYENKKIPNKTTTKYQPLTPNLALAWSMQLHIPTLLGFWTSGPDFSKPS